MTVPSYPSSEMHLGKFTIHTDFQSWIVNFRTEVCLEAKNSMLALQWIKEIEAAKSLDDLITPKSITGKIFPDYDELDRMTAAALKKCYDTQTHFRKKISVEQQRAHKDNRFFRGRTNCLFDLRILSSCWGHLTRFNADRVLSASEWRATTFRTLIYDGSRH